MSVETTHPALRCRSLVVAMLEEAGIEATSDAGKFYPQPIGVLVGLPTLTGRGLASRTFEVPVLVVSGDPLNQEAAVNRLYALADDVALALRAEAYREASWRASPNAQPLNALEVSAVLTVTELEEVS